MAYLRISKFPQFISISLVQVSFANMCEVEVFLTWTLQKG